MKKKPPIGGSPTVPCVPVPRSVNELLFDRFLAAHLRQSSFGSGAIVGFFIQNEFWLHLATLPPILMEVKNGSLQ